MTMMMERIGREISSFFKTLADESPKLLHNVFSHECQRDDIEGKQQRDVGKTVVRRHIEDSSFMGCLTYIFHPRAV